MKVLIIEDEYLAAVRLEEMLMDADPSITIAAKLGSIKESVKWLMSNSADLIFLDIELSDGNSFSIFEQLKVNTPVIFTTTYDQYAIKAFEINSISYLLKPINKKQLEESLIKFRELKSAFALDINTLSKIFSDAKSDFKKRFFIQIGQKIVNVDVSDIAYFYAIDKGIFLRTFQGKSFPIDYALDKLESGLDPIQFFRINRKFLVNLKSISNMTAYSRGRVKLELNPKPDDKIDAIVSIDRSSEFKKWLNI